MVITAGFHPVDGSSIPPPRSMFIKALQLAYKYHDGQYRKESCVPYIVHPLRVSGWFIDDVRKTISVLHDIVEDTDCTLELLSKMFPCRVVNIVDMLTRRDGEKHFDYIRRVKKNEVAVEIKIADIVDNLSDCLSVQAPSLIERYNKSLKILLE